MVETQGAKVWRRPSHSEERERSCYKCGGRFPHDHQGCLAAGYKRKVCLRYGHYKDFCNQPSRGKGNSRFIGTQRGGWRGERDQRGGYRGYRGDHARANHVIDEEKEQRYNDAAQEDDRMQLLQAVTDNDLYVFAASDLSKFKKGRISVLIDNKVPVKFLPDTGASVDIIDRSTYEILMQSNTYPLFETKTRVFAYGAEEPLKLRVYLISMPRDCITE